MIWIVATSSEPKSFDQKLPFKNPPPHTAPSDIKHQGSSTAPSPEGAGDTPAVRDAKLRLLDAAGISPKGPSDRGVYFVPSYLSAELDKAKRGIESEKARAEQLVNQLDSLKTQLDRARLYLDNTSQFDVDEFDRKVNRYNAALEQVRVQNSLVNQMVDDYNAKLRSSR